MMRSLTVNDGDSGTGDVWPGVLQMDAVHFPAAVWCRACLSERS